MTVPVSDETFEAQVLESTIPVLVDFWAPWCGPCHIIAPSLEQLAQEYENRLVVAKVNTDENARYAASYGVRGIPHLILFHQGQILERIVGTVPYPFLKARVDNALAQALETNGPSEAS
jgi:thioredoxin 1